MATKKTTKKSSSKVSSKTAVKAKKPVIKETTSKIQPEINNPATTINIDSKATSKATLPVMDENQKRKVIGVVSSIVVISLFAGFVFYSIPNQILSQTIDKQNAKKAEEDKKQNDIARQGVEAKLELENRVLKFEDNKNWDLVMKITDFGDIKLNLKSEYAPQTVENFVRLTYRESFGNTVFHRIVKQPTFAVIQGGDTENRNGQGGKSAFYISSTEEKNIPDELWTVKPEYESAGDQNKLINKPEFRAPSLYTNFNADTGSVTYKKGLILMAKTDKPDSASSQFFITIADTTLPAQYTVFGVVDSGSFAVLDKIAKDVNAIGLNRETGAEEVAFDGRPSKELRISEVKIVTPNI